MSDTQDDEKDQGTMSPEQLDAYNKAMDDYYKVNTPRLKKQFEYEKLLGDIEEARLRQLMARIRYAQLAAGPPKEPAPGPTEGPTTPAENPQTRKLKPQE
jgi:hypothetical protein